MYLEFLNPQPADVPAGHVRFILAIYTTFCRAEGTLDVPKTLTVEQLFTLALETADKAIDTARKKALEHSKAIPEPPKLHLVRP